MRRRVDCKIFVFFALVLFLGVGYAVVNTVSLTVTGTAGAGNSELKVYFTGEKGVSNTSKLSVDVLAGSTNATFTARDLELNETVSFVLHLINNETDVPAQITITTNGSNEYYTVWSATNFLTIQPGEMKQIGILVNMKKTPITYEDSIANFTITLDAEPFLQPDLITFKVTGLLNDDYAFDPGMTWAEWVESEYNQYDFYVYNRSVAFSTSYVVDEDGVMVGPNDVIKEGHVYSFLLT